MKRYTSKEGKTITPLTQLTGGRGPRGRVLMASLAFVCIVAMLITPVCADHYIGGNPLTTENGTYGIVSGGLWFDAYPGFDDAYQQPIVKNFTLPCDPYDVQWARLYVDAYIGNMQVNYPLNTTVEFYGGTNWITLGSEIMNTTYTFPECEDFDGTIWLSDHSNRVTSDVLTWYDVKNNISSSNVSARVHTAKPDGTQPFDGRVKMITLVVAYDDNSSGKTIHYWVNQGHDTDSYLADDSDCPDYFGETSFNTSVIDSPGTAILTVLPLASYNGNYTFNSTDLTWSNPHQGSYFQWQNWNVTGLINTTQNTVMTFDRNATHSGNYSGFFKIPLALLTVEDE